MNRAAVLALGLLSFGVLSYVCIRTQAPRIERDLLSRSRNVLSANQLPARGLAVDGRDVILRGVAGSPEVSDRAVSLIKRVDGVGDVRVEVQAAPSTPSEPNTTTEPSPQARLDELLLKKRIDFSAGSARLTPEGSAVLDEVAKVLASAPNTRWMISGHTDSVGDPDENQFVSDRRAIVTKEYLVSKGIAADRLIAKGYGASKPVADNSTEEGREKNRRIEFRLQGER